MKSQNEETTKVQHSFEITPKLLKNILLIITFSLFLLWGLTHFGSVLKIVAFITSVLAPFILGFCIAFVINVLLNPLENLWNKIFKKAKTEKHLKFKRSVCIVLSTIVILGLIFSVLFMIIPEIKKALEVFFIALPYNLVKTGAWFESVFAFIEDFGFKLPELTFDFNEISESLKNYISEYGTGFIGKTADITASLFSGVVNIVLGFTFSIYMLGQKEKFISWLKRILYAFVPKKKSDYIINLSVFTGKTFTNFVTGQLTEAVILGLLCFIGMMIFNFPYALITSVLVGITALIPIVGAFIGTVVGAFLILLISPVKAFWFIIFLTVLQQIEGNFIYPKVVGKSVGLPGILVLGAVTLGGRLFGIAGMLFAVPVMSVLYSLFKIEVSKRLKHRKIEI